ncbi:hypothetical protein ACQP04_14170 [Pseudonocardia halophobica]
MTTALRGTTVAGLDVRAHGAGRSPLATAPALVAAAIRDFVGRHR